ncbi:hypothetical protein LCGC14_1570330 [marine sediment metagenome]|uniref:Uncharacterized protein n=1 Tax=marine sediment metagenome TaxID=412755 RepID=A0A0F9L103_9ZZZZ
MGMLPASPSIEEAVNPGKPVVQNPAPTPQRVGDSGVIPGSHESDKRK